MGFDVTPSVGTFVFLEVYIVTRRVLFFAAVVLVSGCSGEVSEDECDPISSAACVCMNEIGRVCNDPTAEGCTCVAYYEDCSDGLCGDSDDCSAFNACPDDMSSDVEYTYVLVEDLSTDMTGESPGADIDAISVTRGGAEMFATGVVDFGLGGGDHLDPTQATGVPDSDCTATHFVSLGGTGGYLIVEFSGLFGSGDAVTVYELGPTTCPDQTMWVDEEYHVSVSISDGLSSFTEIGRGGAGLNILTVP